MSETKPSISPVAKPEGGVSLTIDKPIIRGGGGTLLTEEFLHNHRVNLHQAK